jgi:hypothetical protein
MRQIAGIVIFLSFYGVATGQFKKDLPKDYKEVYEQGFSKEKDLSDFEFSSSDKWLISKDGKSGKSLKCTGAGNYQVSEGEPTIVAVLKTVKLKDFILEMDVLQNGKDFSQLDICLFYGIQDINNYYYAQLASSAGNKSHNVFRVKNDQTERMGEMQSKGIIWGYQKWHTIKLERSVSDKQIKLFMNDELILEVNDESLEAGYIGFGSFDDAFKVDNLTIWAPDYEPVTKATPLFTN